MRCARLWYLGLTLTMPLLAINCSNSYIADQKESCTNGDLDQGETDIDCGGSGCPACDKGKVCSLDKDCGAGLLCATDITDSSAPKRCVWTHCTDNTRNEDETDIDCGGSCESCTAGQTCKNAADCDSRVCTEAVCSQASCSDSKQNQDESDIDCGSLLTACSPCVSGKKCFTDGNCESKLCKSGFCQAATCTDSRKNGSEGDVDCGGSCPTLCSQASSCNKNSDCTSNVCQANTCLSPQCGDGVLNGTETDVDCGGSCGAICIETAGCKVDADCVSSFCNAHICQVPTCTDGIKNQGEADIDCGDLRGYCPPCTPKQICLYPSSCVSNNCVDGRCVDRTCFDFIRNGLEGDVDCGGDCSTKCKDAQSCTEMTDCESGVCTETRCSAPTCSDAVKNGLETDLNCGGPACPKCETGLGCNGNSDCVINSCAGGKCSDLFCANSTLDGTETDVDCGGDRCSECTDTKKCALNADCKSLKCVNLSCAAATCPDGLQNGRETDVDCGGDCVTKCGTGAKCMVSADCTDRNCDAGVCKAATCIDTIKNGLETDADCGGAECSILGETWLCATGKICARDADCKAQLVCDLATGKCLDWSCSDGRKNQDETDVDCGGKTCSGCATDKACVAGSDCKDKICTVGKTCAKATCTDSTKNGDEGSVDCGGSACAKCLDGDDCNVGSDCSSGVCGITLPKKCLVPTCSDLAKNGSETDVDCGGPCTTKCGDGKVCVVQTDCATGTTCTPEGGVSVLSYCRAPNCNNLKLDDGLIGHLDNGETDVDCGGPNCGPCGVSKICANAITPSSDAYCSSVPSGKCIGGICAAAACNDVVKNGAESDIDCGGSGASSYPVCNACIDGKKCSAGTDCASKSCNVTCLAPTCADNIQNGGEVGLDCGTVCASFGKGCANDAVCTLDTDCSSGWCNPSKLCKTRTCVDGILNGTEGDTDCGAICGSVAKLCTVAAGQGCKVDADCDSATCSECTGKCINASNQCLKQGTGCAQCNTGTACSVDFDCKSLTCDPSSKLCLAADNCAGKVLSVGTCSDSCNSLLRCLFLNSCTLDTPCALASGPCGPNTLGTDMAPYDAARAAMAAMCP